MYGEFAGYVFENHKGIILVSGSFKLFAGFIVCRVSDAREERAHEIQGRFQSGRRCFGNSFILRQTLRRRYTFSRPPIFLFLEPNATFYSLDHAACWSCLTLENMPGDLISIFLLFYANTRSRIRAHIGLSLESIRISGDHQIIPLSSFLSNLFHIKSDLAVS